MTSDHLTNGVASMDLDLSTISGTDLLEMDCTQREEVVTGLLPAGCTLLAGNAKEGKSLLAYHLAACVGTGQPFLGTFPVQQGQVLFFALEDGEMRGQARLRMQQQQLGLAAEDLAEVQFRFWDAPRLGAGFETWVERWMATHQETRLIIIDILEKIRPRGSFWQDLYQEGYQATAPLARMAQERNIALLVVHHSTKNPHSDPRLRVSGPMSLLGGADNAWVLSRPYGESEAELTIAGRDLVEQEWLLHFEQGLWNLVGPLKEHRQSSQRQEVLEVLDEEPTGQRPWQLAQALGKNPSTVRSLLKKMRADGDVTLEAGRYTRGSSKPASLPEERGVHAVHPVAPAATTPEPAPTVDASQEKPAWPVDAVDSVDSSHRVDSALTEDSGNTGDTGYRMDAATNGHRSNGVDRSHTANSLDAGNTVDSGDMAHREDSSNRVDSWEDDPFLAPDPFVDLPVVPVGEEEPAERDPPAQESTAAQESTIQEGDWFWPLLPGGARHSHYPWQAVDIETIPNGTVLIYGMVKGTGKLHRWRLDQCQKTAPPPGEQR